MARREIPAEVIGRAQAMSASGMSNLKIAAILGMSRDTVRRYIAGETPKSADKAEIAIVEATTRERVRANVETFLVKASDVAATDDFVGELRKRPKDLVIGIGIGVEKMELLAGRATSRDVSLRIELIAGASLPELATRSMKALIVDTTAVEAPSRDAS